jgi:hypothetical protein
VRLGCLGTRRGCLGALFIAPRGLGAVAFSTRKLENFPICGLTTQSNVPPDSPVRHWIFSQQRPLDDLIGRFTFPMWHQTVPCTTEQLTCQLAIGGSHQSAERAVGDDVRCTVQCTVHCLVNFMNKISESSVFGHTLHRTWTTGQSGGS